MIKHVHIPDPYLMVKVTNNDLVLQLKNESISRSVFQKLQEEYEFDDKWLPLIDYLCSF